jgi:hypothetical protein
LTDEERELAIDQLAHELGMNVIKESSVTGYSYTILSKDDTWYYLLNHCEPTATWH